MAKTTNPHPVGDRVLLVVDVYPDGGGIAAIVENCVQALGQRYEVHVAIVDAREQPAETLGLPASRVHILGSRSFLKPYLAPTSLAYTVRVGRLLRRVIRRLQPGAVLVQDGLFLPVPALIATRGLETKVAIMDHGTLTNSLDREWRRMFPKQLGFPKSVVYRIGFALDGPWRAMRWRLGFRHADRVWYVGEEMKRLLGPAGDRARKYNQVVPGDFKPPTPRQRAIARDRWGVAADRVVINMVTRLAREKGLPEVLDAVEAVTRDARDVRVLIAGWGPLESWLRTEIESRRMTDVIALVGALDRAGVQSLHHASDFHLYAGTIGCGMSVALLEALASGTLPIVSDVPQQHRELASPAGWVFRAGDIGSLVDALRGALQCAEEERVERRGLAAESLRRYAHPSLTDLVAEVVPS